MYGGAIFGGIALEAGAVGYVSAKAAQAILQAYRAGTLTIETLNTIAIRNPRLYWYLIAILNEATPTGTGPTNISPLIEMDVKVTKMTVDELIRYLKELMNQPENEPEPQPEPKPEPEPDPNPQPEPDPEPNPEPEPKSNPEQEPVFKFF